MTSYRCSIVAMSLSRVVSDIFSVEKYCDLETPVKSQSRSLKVVPFDRLGMIIYYCSIVILSLSRTVFETSNVLCDLENRVRSPSRSLKMSPFDTARMTSY